MELAGAPPLAVAVANHGTLPIDKLLDILLRLPVQEVCRIQLVCRTWRSLMSDPLFARAYASHHPPPHVIVVRHHDDEASEVRAIDLHGNVVKWRRIQKPIDTLSMYGDLLCASHGWRLTSVVDMVTGAVADVAPQHRKKVNLATPHCMLGHVRTTGEYKVLRIQADYFSRQQRQTCEVVTLGGGGDAGRWRRRPCPPVIVSILPGTSSWNAAVVAGLASFIIDEREDKEPDRIAVFDLAAEEWKPATLQGPLTSLIASTVDEEENKYDEYIRQHIMPGYDRRHRLLRRKHFQLARLGDSLVVLHCNVKNGSTDLWFLEDMEDDTTLEQTLHITGHAVWR